MMTRWNKKTSLDLINSGHCETKFSNISENQIFVHDKRTKMKISNISCDESKTYSVATMSLHKKATSF